MHQLKRHIAQQYSASTEACDYGWGAFIDMSHLTAICVKLSLKPRLSGTLMTFLRKFVKSV